MRLENPQEYLALTIQQLLEAYDIQTTEALKDLLGGTIREMMEAEMDYTDPQLGTGVWSVKHHV